MWVTRGRWHAWSWSDDMAWAIGQNKTKKNKDYIKKKIIILIDKCTIGSWRHVTCHGCSWAWTCTYMHMMGMHMHGCMGLGTSRILIHMHWYNGPGQHRSKLVLYKGQCVGHGDKVIGPPFSTIPYRWGEGATSATGLDNMGRTMSYKQLQLKCKRPLSSHTQIPYKSTTAMFTISISLCPHLQLFIIHTTHEW